MKNIIQRGVKPLGLDDTTITVEAKYLISIHPER